MVVKRTVLELTYAAREGLLWAVDNIDKHNRARLLQVRNRKGGLHINHEVSKLTETIPDGFFEGKFPERGDYIIISQDGAPSLVKMERKHGIH